MILKNKTTSICACAKNVAKHLPLSISKIEMIASVFQGVKIFIFENDSTDDTLCILKDWSKNNKSVEVISENNIPLKSTKSWYKRVETLAYARNKLLEKTHEYNPDYYIAIDLDEVISGLTLDGFLSSFSLSFDWSMVGANQTDYYYDLWPLRTFDDWMNYDCWEECVPKHGYEKCIESKKRNIPINSDPIEVLSCFGGLGIYKHAYTTNCTYRRHTTEHLYFHKQMREKHNARFFINPKMIGY